MVAGSDRKGVQGAKGDVINLGKRTLSLSPPSAGRPYARLLYFILSHFLAAALPRIDGCEIK